MTAVFSVTTAVYALPPASDLTARERNSTVPRATRAQPDPVETTETAASSKRSSTTIVIDAGHGGFDRGGIRGQRVSESMMTLDVALRLRSILQASGYRVVMTRSTDVFVPLGARVAIANSYRDAIFVCIHFNSATRRGANGIETYFYRSDSLRLASAIHYNVVGATPTPNRGVRRRGFFVLRKTSIPSVLVECGFLTNPTEAQYAQSSAYRQKLAEAIGRGVRSRGSVSSSRVATTDTVPLQPFIDQTRVRHSSVGRSKRVSKRSKATRSKKSSSSSSSTKKKTSSENSEN